MSGRNSTDEEEVRTVSISEFRANCSALLKRVQKTKKPIQVTLLGRPLAEIRSPGLSPEMRAHRDARDVEILNRYAAELNADAEELARRSGVRYGR
jgi:prevent-host-death family protein